MTIPAAIRGFNIAIPIRSRIAKIHKTTFNIISPYQITKDCNNKFKKITHQNLILHKNYIAIWMRYQRFLKNRI